MNKPRPTYTQAEVNDALYRALLEEKEKELDGLNLSPYHRTAAMGEFVSKAWKTIYANHTAEKPQPVYCCDDMRVAVGTGLIGFPPQYPDGPIIMEGETLESYLIKFCPFCGAAIEIVNAND